MAKPPVIPDYDKPLLQEDAASYQNDDSNELPPTDIVAFNELRSCADLLRMHERKQLEIRPDFQRDVVWKQAAQTRFIDSLIKQLPIPSMCISLDGSSDKRLVIDGLQRMSSIIRFLGQHKKSWRLSDLPDIDRRIAGKTVDEVRKSNSSLYARVENITIPITVIRCDYKKPSHMEYLFTIFHRLNTGGTKLTNQEIRNCIFSGELNQGLQAAVKNTTFKNLFGIEDGKKYRFKYEEFVLRVLVFENNHRNYDGSLSRYLNTYMEANRENKKIAKHAIDVIARASELIETKLAPSPPLSELPTAVSEALFVGIISNLTKRESDTAKLLKARFDKLLRNKDFAPENLRNAITSKDKQIARIEAAKEYFS